MRPHLRTLVGIIAIAVAVGLVPTDTHGQEISRIAGTWVPNRRASSFGLLGALLSARRTYEDRGDGMVRAEFRGVDSSGLAIYGSYTAKHDGTEYRFVARGTDGYRTIALTRVNAYTSNWVITLNGAVLSTGQNTVSRDGLTYTVAATGASALVFDRRPQ